MRINSLRSMYMIIWGIPFIHLLDLGLCGFFVNRFLIKTYDPDVFLLLFLFLGMLILIDVLSIKYRIVQRCFLRFQMDHEGLKWYLIKAKQTSLAWSEIQTYGIVGYDRINQPYAFVFFSKNSRERNDLQQKMHLSDQRIVIQIRKETLCIMEQYLPRDMKKILSAIETKQDCFYRR